jgi:hypothetical protein
MSADPLTAMISYSWDDAIAAELLHEELALRGLAVFHDRCTFPTSTRIAHSMADAVGRCDAFVAYLTPSSLYLGQPSSAPRPALDNEFLPTMERWRQAVPRRPGVPRIPVVVPLTHGLGDPHTEAPGQVFEATGEDISSLWAPITLDQSSAAITQSEAATVAAGVINAVLDAHGVPEADSIELVIATRGEGQPSGLITVDATGLLGGPTSRPGTERDWDRLLAALRDVQAALARSTTQRHLHIVAKAHISACMAVGRVFNQAAGWRLTVAGRHGDTTLQTRARKPRIQSVLDPVGGPGPMTVEIDLIGGNVTELATALIRANGEAPTARLQIRSLSPNDLQPTDVGVAAVQTAMAIRHYIASIRPQTVRLFCACPAEFAVLIGSRLTSLHADLALYERDGDHYVPALHIPRAVP